MPSKPHNASDNLLHLPDPKEKPTRKQQIQRNQKSNPQNKRVNPQSQPAHCGEGFLREPETICFLVYGRYRRKDVGWRPLTMSKTATSPKAILISRFVKKPSLVIRAGSWIIGYASFSVFRPRSPHDDSDANHNKQHHKEKSEPIEYRR